MSVFAFKIKVLIYRRARTTSIFSSFQRRWCRQCSELTRSQNPSTSMPYLGAYFTIFISPHRSRTLSSSRVMFLTRVNRSRKLPAKKNKNRKRRVDPIIMVPPPHATVLPNATRRDFYAIERFFLFFLLSRRRRLGSAESQSTNLSV